MSLSKNQIKLVNSLHQKKYRIINSLFIVEGKKTTEEFLNSNFELEHLFSTSIFEYKNQEKVTIISESELKKISSLKTPNSVLALFKIPKAGAPKNRGLILVLDEINDPGNLGTIIRLCDWFGVEQLICSENTVDCYNPKVIQASMGSLCRMSVIYTELQSFLQNSNLPKFATQMTGENMYDIKLPKEAILIMGNEANGINEDILDIVNKAISIPRYGDFQKTESLNVSTATAIFLSEFRR